MKVCSGLVLVLTLEFMIYNLFLGTLGDGIWVVNKQSPREFKQLSGIKELNSQNIYQLIFDDENNLWAGTEKGVNKIVIDENNTINEVFYFDRNDGFLGIETCQNAVDKDAEGNIWFGTMNGGLSFFDGERFVNYHQFNSSIGDNEVCIIYEDKAGNIWFSSEGFGVYRHDGKSFTNFFKKQGLGVKAVQAIYEDKEGRFWVGGGGGLYRYDGESFVNVTKNGPWN